MTKTSNKIILQQLVQVQRAFGSRHLENTSLEGKYLKNCLDTFQVELAASGIVGVEKLRIQSDPFQQLTRPHKKLALIQLIN